MDERITSEELAKCSGEEERPVWVAVDGKVFDLSQSPLWKRGIHMNRHRSGEDLTADLQAAPHGKEVLGRATVREVGVLLEEESESPLPFWSHLSQRFPILQRHPHPMTIHFPIAYLVAAVVFALLDLIVPEIAPFEDIAFALLVLGFLFTPFAIGTGWLTWRLNYGGRPVPQVARKIRLAAFLIFLEIACLLIRMPGLVEAAGARWLYPTLLFVLSANVLLLGYYGGQLTFPYKKG